MKNILHKRILELGRGEEGVALVVTLAVFMFMYIFCAGVFAVGKMVKDRICLQNAADAAAYSAAVVQADTFSRIATINRAMSWTYAQMNKRRMDFIVYRWMEHARDHYKSDRRQAASWVRRSLGPEHSPGNRPYHGQMYISEMRLNERGPSIPAEMRAYNSGMLRYQWPNAFVPVENTISSGLQGYERYFNTDTDIVGSCFNTGGQSGIDGLERQIDADMEAIWKMNRAEWQLMRDMGKRIDTAAREILRANVPDFNQCAYVVKRCRNPENPINGFLTRLGGEPQDEYRFLEWGNNSSNRNGHVAIPLRRYLHWDPELENSDCSQRLYNHYYGYNVDLSTDNLWFRPASDALGLRWYYAGTLAASWTWWSWYCSGCHFTINHRTGAKIYHGPNERPLLGNCNHSHNGCGCAPLQTHIAICRADNSDLRRDYGWVLYGRYNPNKRSGHTAANNNGGLLLAQPYRLNSRFFGRDGTITVGVARPNYNPWRDQYVMGPKNRQPVNIGLYHAFDPFLDWMVCFASARAGYKAVIDDVDRELENRYCRARVENGPRDYCIDYKDLRPVARKVTDKYSEKYGWYKQVELVLPTWRQRWNLCQSDWDAVMIPVCRAGSGVFENLDTDFTYGYLREPCWRQINSHYLADIVESDDWHSPEDGPALEANWYAFRAGCRRPEEIHDYGTLTHSHGDLSELLDQLPEHYHGWNADTVQRGGTRAIKWPYAWRVSGQGQRLDWTQLQQQMLH